VGDGSKRGEIQELIAGDERFKYLGKLDGKALESIYAGADFTVVPSLVYENCPTVILESFATGTPVIASRAGGIPELVRDGENGFLFLPGSATSVEQALTSASYADWQKLSKSAMLSAEALALNSYIKTLLKEAANE
jgi:glycosyltransferase involved in cell wall biosynthesis